MSIEPLSWLLVPISGAATHDISPWLSWHGRLMVLAWGIALPAGVLLARFFKVTPRQDWPRQLDNKFWWHSHVGLQYSGVLLMSTGIALAWGRGGSLSLAAQAHAWTGWLLLGLGWLQVAGGILRGSKGGPLDASGQTVMSEQSKRGDHYDMTPRRRRFERWHKLLGYTALAASVLAINLGLALADAPRWMWLGMWVWWAFWIGSFVTLQTKGRCIDTYQAIWGSGQEHPGNQMESLGWGMHRYSADAENRRPTRQDKTQSDEQCD